MLIEKVYDFFEEVVGADAPFRIRSYVINLFLIILIANLLGLAIDILITPFPNLSTLIASPTGNLNFTLALAICSVIITLIIEIKSKKLTQFLKKYLLNPRIQTLRKYVCFFYPASHHYSHTQFPNHQLAPWDFSGFSHSSRFLPPRSINRHSPSLCFCTFNLRIYQNWKGITASKKLSLQSKQETVTIKVWKNFFKSATSELQSSLPPTF